MEPVRPGSDGRTYAPSTSSVVSVDVGALDTCSTRGSNCSGTQNVEVAVRLRSDLLAFHKH